MAERKKVLSVDIEGANTYELKEIFSLVQSLETDQGIEYVKTVNGTHVDFFSEDGEIPQQSTVKEQKSDGRKRSAKYCEARD